VTKPKVTVSLDADLAIDVMMLSGAGSPQDAVELIVRDYLARGRRTEASTGEADDSGRLFREQHGDAERG
jgi:Arc/MetJ family transcription regulator